jgi:hypothetical protein
MEVSATPTSVNTPVKQMFFMGKLLIETVAVSNENVT